MTVEHIYFKLETHFKHSISSHNMDFFKNTCFKEYEYTTMVKQQVFSREKTFAG